MILFYPPKLKNFITQNFNDIIDNIMKQKNVLGSDLEICNESPMTGFFRDGCCNTNKLDTGSHTVCVIVTKEFLEFSKSQGNDLSTPRPEFDFPGLNPGDGWCLCAVKKGNIVFLNVGLLLTEQIFSIVELCLFIEKMIAFLN